MAESELPSTQWVQAAVEKYEQPLTVYALRITGDLELARDAVQEAFLRLCAENPAKVRDHLAEWLFSVCRSRAVDRHRKEKRMTVLTQIPAPPLHTQPSPSEQVETNESTTLALKTLGSLPPNQQEAIRLKFQHGLSYRQIASVMQMTVTNVGFLIHTGLKSIRQQMNASETRSLAR